MRFAIGILALVAIPVAIVFLLAPHSPRMASAALYMARAVERPRRNFESEIREGRVGLGPEVPLTTSDKLVAELKLPRVDVIKMDLVGRLNPQYQMRCTECGNTTGRIQPEVLLAW